MFDEIIEEEVQAPTNLNEAIEAKALEILTDPNIDLTQTTLRSSTAINRRALQDTKIAIVGLGGLGNHVVQQVAGMGFEKIYVFDPDTVEIHNVGPQRHPITFLGEYKVDVAEKINVLTNGFKFMHKGYDTLKGYADIYNVMGAPDVLITAVDNMDFRNSLAYSFREYYSHQLPKLLIDMRMTLGDWTTYVVPLQWCYMTNTSDIFNTYKNELFNQDEAVQEACTERSIIYTGANAASYTCAVLHWYANNGEFSDAMLDMSSDAPIKYKMTFSSRDWEFITPTRKEIMMLKNIRKLKEEVDTMEHELEKGRVPEVQTEPDPAPEPEPAPEPIEERLPPINLDTLREGMLMRLAGEDIIYEVIRVNDRGVTVQYDGQVTNISRALLAEGGCVL